MEEKKESPVLTETTEQGIVIMYYHRGGMANVDFEAKEDAYYPNNDTQGFTTFDTLNDGSFTDKFEDGDDYISGTVKWDGCSHYYFGDEGYLHLCGKQPIKCLQETIEHIYKVCGEIMKKDGVYLMEDEFKLTTK